ncbi:Probable NAD(P)H dehydrogenase (quinone) FQR1-like 2 [Linum perenne]
MLSSSPEPSEDHVATTTNNNPTAEAQIRSDDAVNFKVFIVFYSIYGHVELLARRMKKGVDGVEGVEAVLYRVLETLSSEVLEQMKAPPKDPSIPDITEATDLVEADGILFGFPTRSNQCTAYATVTRSTEFSSPVRDTGVWMYRTLGWGITRMSSAELVSVPIT